MASINSLMRSSGGNSIYGNRNVISGLASGMDTEAMIENAVKGQKLKITYLEKQRARVEWQQEAYRNIINKLSNFSLKYSSYTSGTNLASPAFFDSAVEILTHGANADKVTAIGKSSSTIQVDSVEKLATSAQYSTVGSFNASNVAGQSMDLNGSQQVGTLDGALTLKYGDVNVKIAFDENDVYQSAQEMADSINKKLEEQTIKFTGGGQEKASERIKAVVHGGTVSFETVDPNDQNGVHVESVDDKLNEILGIAKNSDDKFEDSFTFGNKPFTEKKSNMEIVAEKGFEITVDGVTKTIKGPNGAKNDQEYIDALQKEIDQAFGSGKLTVADDDSAAGQLKLKFESTGHTQFSVQSEADKVLGMEGGLTSSLNLERKLGDLLNLNQADWEKHRIYLDDVSKITNTQEINGEIIGTDDAGNSYKKDSSGKWHQVDKDGNDLYAFKVNGKSVANVTKETTLQDLINQVNSNPDSDVKVVYSQFTQKFTFTAKESGANGQFELEGLAADMFGTTGAGNAQPSSGYTAGQDAVFHVSVNGGPSEEITQSSNTINIDGMSITMNETFADGGAVTFSTRTDTDKIMDAIKTMVKDYNDLATEIKKAYETVPQKDSHGNNFEPLSDEERSEMSESEIKRYEEKAKEGLLFADRDLSGLYQGLTEALNVFSVTGSDMQQLGITTTFKEGVTTLEIDEEQLRKTLETDPDKVKDAFTRKASDGETAGVMEGLKTQIDKYAATTGADKGILVKKAGSPLAPTSIMQNDLQEKISDFDKQIEVMRLRVADQIDYYNRKFSALEQMVAQMNSQSSSLMGMMGGY